MRYSSAAMLYLLNKRLAS